MTWLASRALVAAASSIAVGVLLGSTLGQMLAVYAILIGLLCLVGFADEEARR